MNKKIILFFLVVSVVLLSLISCTEENYGNPQNSSVDSSAPQIDSETAPGEETTSLIKDNLPDKFDFGVDKANILNWSDTEHVEFFTENLNGEVVNDAIYNRNITVSTRLGVELNFISTPGNTSNIQNYVTKYANSYNAGEKAYDVLASYSRTMSTVAQQGYCMDMTKIDYIDLDMPWWPQSLYDEANINGALYFASGDISINMLYMMYALIVNLDIAEEFQLPDLFEIVNNGEWTWEKMQELIHGTYIDLNNSAVKDDADRFGDCIPNRVNGNNLHNQEKGENHEHGKSKGTGRDVVRGMRKLGGCTSAA